MIRSLALLLSSTIFTEARIDVSKIYCSITSSQGSSQYWKEDYNNGPLYPYGPLQPIDVSFFETNVPVECSPPMGAGFEVAGTWYSLRIPAAETFVLNSTFYVDASTKWADSSRYIAVVQVDNNCWDPICLGHKYFPKEASIDFDLITNKDYYVFIAMALDDMDNSAFSVGVVPTCEDKSDGQKLALSATLGEEQIATYCSAEPRPFPSRVEPVSLPLGDGSEPFSVRPEEPKLFQIPVSGHVGNLYCELDIDDDNGNADLYVGIDKVPTSEHHDCSTVGHGSDDEHECRVVLNTASAVIVLVQGTARGLEINCEMRDSELLALGDGVDDFHAYPGEPKLFRYSVQDESGVLHCEIEPDDDNGYANLYLGLDMVPTTENYNNCMNRASTSEQDCRIFLRSPTTASVVNVLVVGSSQDIEVKCNIESSEIDLVPVDMTSDEFYIEAGDYRGFHIDAPKDETQSVSCEVNNAGLKLYMSGSPGCVSDRSSCRANTSGGRVRLVVEGANAVSNGIVRCQVDLDPSTQSFDEDEAEELDLGEEETESFFSNQARGFWVMVPVGVTAVGCRASNTSDEGLQYSMRLHRQSRWTGCSPGTNCWLRTPNGVQEVTYAYISVVSTVGAFVEIICGVERIGGVREGAKFLAWYDGQDNKYIDDDDGKLFYLIVPPNTFSISCYVDGYDLETEYSERLLIYGRLNSPPTWGRYDISSSDGIYNCYGNKFAGYTRRTCQFSTQRSNSQQILYVRIRHRAYYDGEWTSWGEDDVTVRCGYSRARQGQNLRHIGDPDLSLP